MTRALVLIALLAGAVLAHADGDEHEYFFYGATTGTKLVLSTKIPLPDLRSRIESSNVNNFVRVWSGRGARLDGEHIVEAFGFSTDADTLGLILQSGLILVLDHASDPGLSVLSPATAAVLLGYNSARGGTVDTLEHLLHEAGELMSEVELHGVSWRDHFPVNQDTDDLLTFEDMLKCERELNGRG